jgi:hypothetical protein
MTDELATATVAADVEPNTMTFTRIGQDPIVQQKMD